MTAYNLTKAGALISIPDGMPKPGPYYTCLLAMHDVVDFPYDYVLYFSTDHHNGPGGLWAYFCNGLPSEADWISYDDALKAGAFDHVAQKPAANPIFVDTVQGNGHTETPHAQVVNGQVYLSYHKNGIEGTQKTIMAISADGITFKRKHGDADSVILSYDIKSSVGDGHTGYFRWSLNPFDGVTQKYIGYSLHGGGDRYHSAVWVSNDALAWERIDILIPLEGQAIDNDNCMIVWHEIDPSSIRKLDNGEYAAICGVGNRASGAAARIVELYEIYLASDGRTLTRQSKKLLSVGSSSAEDAEELTSPSCLIIDGTVHLIYVGAGQKGSINTVMSARGTFNPSYNKALPLAEVDQKRHLLKN